MKKPQDHQQSKAKREQRAKKAADTITSAMRLFAGNMAFTTFRSNQTDQTQHWLSSMDDDQLRQLITDVDAFRTKLDWHAVNRVLKEDPKEEDQPDA